MAQPWFQCSFGGNGAVLQKIKKELPEQWSNQLNLQYFGRARCCFACSFVWFAAQQSLWVDPKKKNSYTFSTTQFSHSFAARHSKKLPIVLSATWPRLVNTFTIFSKKFAICMKYHNSNYLLQCFKFTQEETT